MNFLSWTLALLVLVLLLLKGAQFYRALVCRQEAWQMSFDLGSRYLFPNAGTTETSYHASCHLFITRKHKQVSWQKVPSLKRNIFDLELSGSL
jgi:hypothetical protein